MYKVCVFDSRQDKRGKMDCMESHEKNAEEIYDEKRILLV